MLFAKYHGAGNDFILIDDRKKTFPVDDSALISRLCEHRLGIGADGLVLLQPSEKADFRMRIFNCDGKEAEMCGNGLRCLAHFIRKLGDKRPMLRVEAGEQMTTCSFEGENVTVDMGSYRWIESGIQIGGRTIYAVHTGVPHAVVFENAGEDFVSIARAIRSHSHFQPEGVNVNFATVKNGKIHTRTYERGVEDETLACGTGAAAVAVVASKLHSLDAITIVPASKEKLHIKLNQNQITLTGPAVFVFEGKIEAYDHWNS